MAIVIHGTTRRRAERISAVGPDPDFIESGGGGRAESFSTYLKSGPFLLGAPEDYARAKAVGFPHEGGPAILEVEVPDDRCNSMSTSHAHEVIGNVLAHSATRSVVDLVDDLVAACEERGLQIDWRAERCRVRADHEDWQELTEVSLRKPVFRAILARIAALCNEQSPNSVSPYGGEGWITIGAESGRGVRVAFTNTADEQRLELRSGPRPNGKQPG